MDLVDRIDALIDERHLLGHTFYRQWVAGTLPTENLREYALYIAGGWLLPGRRRIVPYSIQTLKRLKPALFRQDLVALLDLLREKKIKPVVAERFPLAQARQAQELLAKGGVIGKIVLVCGGS